MNALDYCLLLINFLVISNLYAEIIFKDDFTGDYTKNWIAMGAGEIGCKKSIVRSICNTDNQINVRIINGTLALTAIHEKYFDRLLTSATLTSRQEFEIDGSFNYFFRTRLALPNEVALTGNVFLQQLSDANPDFDIVYHHHPATNYTYEFKVYDVVFINDSVIWRINNLDMISMSIKSFVKFRSLYLIRFKLQISLRIDEKFKEISEKLSCSSFIIDYVEFYKFNKSSTIEYPEYSSELTLSAHQICSNINHLKNKTFIIPSLIKELNLLWSDEFEGNSLNQSNWSFEKVKDCNDGCYDNYGAHNDSNGLVEISKGTLKIMPRRRNISIKNSKGFKVSLKSYLTSKRCFKNVRIEIRAKRPVQTDTYNVQCDILGFGKKSGCDTVFLERYPDSMMIAELRAHDEGQWQQKLAKQNNIRNKYEIDSINGIFNSYMAVFTTNLAGEQTFDGLNQYVGTEENLDEFQLYGIEWNEVGAQWLFNGRVVGQANRKYNQHGEQIDYNGNLPYDNPLKIKLEISQNSWYEIRNLNGEPPILEIDYIRVYGQKEVISNFSNNTTLLNQELQSRNNSLIIIISTVLVVFLVITSILFAIIIKQRRSVNNQDENNHDYINSRRSDKELDFGEHIYEDVYYTNRYECVPDQINEYLEITVNQLDDEKDLSL